MEVRRSYERLKPENRVVIAGLLMQGASRRHIARVAGCSLSAISRELARNAVLGVAYSSESAHAASVA